MPASTAPKPHPDASAPVADGGIGASRDVAKIGARQVIASIRYSVDRSTQRSITPASSGPTIAPNCMTVMFNALAAGSWSPGSIRGIAAARVGELIAKNACCTERRHSTTHTLSRARADCSHSSTEAAANPHDVMISSRRRSIASAQAPPHSPNTTSGTRANSPDNPT